MDKDRRLGRSIKNKVDTINLLGEFENHTKFKKRRTVAEENMSQSRALKKQREADILRTN